MSIFEWGKIFKCAEDFIKINEKHIHVGCIL